LDAVVNNAGFSLMGSVEDFTVEQSPQFETTFFGFLRVCRAKRGFVPRLGQA
jgi:short-subunit dehydrogenase